MLEQTIIDWIRLINTEKVGPVNFYKYLEKYGSADEALKFLSQKQDIFSEKMAANELKTAEKEQVKIVLKDDPLYPQGLKELNDAPPVLYIKGNADLLNYPASLAVVGSRNASLGGRKLASKISYDLTTADVLIVSGMARGIDTSAHKGALYAKNQTAPTLAVLGTGVDVCYPEENKEVYERICSQGVVISEFLLGTTANISNFPRRNRIISAISVGTLVVEASLNSGSLITARLAMEQGKDVYAVPGSPLAGNSSGTNKLIKDGAILVEDANDILESLKITQNRQLKSYQKQKLNSKPLDNNKKEDLIALKEKNTDLDEMIKTIGSDGIETDALIRMLKLNVSDAMVQITELELKGFISKSGSGIVLTKEGLKRLK